MKIYALYCCPGYNGTHVVACYESEGRAKVMADLGNILSIKKRIRQELEWLQRILEQPVERPFDKEDEKECRKNLEELRKKGKAHTRDWPSSWAVYWISPVELKLK